MIEKALQVLDLVNYSFGSNNALVIDCDTVRGGVNRVRCNYLTVHDHRAEAFSGVIFIALARCVAHEQDLSPTSVRSTDGTNRRNHLRTRATSWGYKDEQAVTAAVPRRFDQVSAGVP